MPSGGVMWIREAPMKDRRIAPGPGQESVWDYPRPPRVESTRRHVTVVFNGVTIADSRHAYIVLETSHPPGFYIPADDVRTEYLILTGRTSWCEWKGKAQYYTVRVEEREAANAAWAYPRPTRGFEAITDHISFYPHLMDGCFVDGEKVRPQAGGFYGGWITDDVVGPFKGEPGSLGW